MNKLSTLFPKELRRVRLGTCYNSLTRKLILDTKAFDLSKVPRDKLLFDPGLGNLNFSASSSSSSSSYESMLGLDFKAKLGFSICQASAGFNMSLAEATQKDHQELCGYLSYTITGASISILKSLPEIQYKWMSPEFKILYKKFMKAPAIEKLKAYRELTDFFGHGVVTHIDLTSGAYGKFSIISSDSASSNSSKYGASLTVGGVSAGISAAADWGKKIQSASQSASVSVDTDWYPANSPAKEWAIELYNMAKKHGLSILKKGAELKDLPTPSDVKAPKFPKFKKDKEDKKEGQNELPLQENFNDDNLDAILNELRLADGEEARDQTNEQWQDFIQELINIDVGPRVVQEAREINTQDLVQLTNEQDDSNLNEDYDGEYNDQLVDELGGFIPCGFKITPWKEIFPEMQLAILPTLNAVNLSKLNAFYYTRIQFGQYLEFLGQLPFRLVEIETLDQDIFQYNKVCKDFLTFAISNIGESPFNKSKYKKLIKRFDTMLSNIVNKNKFASKHIYDLFFDNYEFFKKSCYGIIPYFDGVEQIQNGHPLNGKPFYPSISYASEHDLGHEEYAYYPNLLRSGSKRKEREKLKEAIRLYPVIMKNGHCHLTYYKDIRAGWCNTLEIRKKEDNLYQDGWTPTVKINAYAYSTDNNKEKFDWAWDSLEELINYTKAGDNSLKALYYKSSGRGEDSSSRKDITIRVSFQSFGHEEIPDDGSYDVRGIGMFSDFPFDELMSMLRNNN